MGLRAPLVVAGACLGVSIGGCVAVPALVQCRKAEAELRAESAQPAEVPAVIYELTLARAYLEKAREEASEAHYGMAIELAASSRRALERARWGRSHAKQGRH